MYTTFFKSIFVYMFLYYMIVDPRKLFDSTREDRSHLLNMSHDHDDDKYKRRPAFQWFARWFK